MSESKIDVLHCVLLFVFSALIIICARGDLWFDEIWSIKAAESAGSVTEIFTRFKHDNNHPINTFYMYLVGKSGHSFTYRLLAVASGIGSLALAGFIGRRRSRSEGLIALILFGTSYPLLLYFSEARGYGTAIFFALLGYFMITRAEGEFDSRQRYIFWAVVTLGGLAHATFVMPLFAFAMLSFGYYRSSSTNFTGSLIELVKDYWFPAAFYGFYYLYFLRHVSIGSGPVFSYYDQFSIAAAYLLGLPDHPITRWFAVAVTVVLVFAGSKLLRERNRVEWMFFPIVVLISPILLVWLTRPTYFYFRYILLSFPFFYLLMAFMLAYLFSRAKTFGRPIAVVILVAFVAGQSVQIIPLLKYQRGSYLPLLQNMAERSSGTVLSVASDYDFRNEMLIEYYKRFIDERSEIIYVNYQSRNDLEPRWFVTHHLDPEHVAPSTIKVSELGRYDIVASYRTSGNSGWNWYLYESAE